MKAPTFITTGIAVFFGILLLKISPALVGRFTDQVSYQLLQAALALGLTGNFELTHEPSVDLLDDGEHRNSTNYPKNLARSSNC